MELSEKLGAMNAAANEEQLAAGVEQSAADNKQLAIDSERSTAEEYLALCTEQVRCKKMRPVLARELQAHIEDQMEEYLEEGKSEEEALRLAVEQMGDPVEAGSAFDRVHRPKMDWKALGMVCAAALVGVLLYAVMYWKGAVGLTLFQNFLKGTFVGILVMILVCFADYTILGKHPRLVWFGGVAATVLITVTSPRVNGRALVGWTTVLLIPLFAGVVYHYRTQRCLGIIKALAVFFFSWLILHAVGALDTSSMNVLLAVSCLMMLILAIARGWYQVPGKIAGILAAGAAAVPAGLMGYVYFFTNGYRRHRLQAWLDPDEFADGAGYYAVQMAKVRGQLNLTGAGRTDGQWLKETLDTSESFLFLGMLQCFGVIVCGTILLLLVWLLAMLFVRVMKIRNRLGFLVGTASCCAIAIPLILHVMINLNLLPVTDCWMPFFSGGGKSCVAFYAVLGLLMSVFRNRECAPEACGAGGMSEVETRRGSDALEAVKGSGLLETPPGASQEVSNASGIPKTSTCASMNTPLHAQKALTFRLPGGKLVCQWIGDKR